MNALAALVREFDAAALALVAGLAWVLIVIRRAQDGGFSWAKAMSDDSGKESALRFGIIVALVVSSWLLVYVTINVLKVGADLDPLFPYFVAYLGFWSGAKVAEKAIDAILLKFGGKPAP